jgi:hypothetical protein
MFPSCKNQANCSRMRGMTDLDMRLEYSKLLLDRSIACQRAFENAVRHFYLSALFIFVLLGFRPAKLSVFGATIALPRTLIAVLGPMALVFLFRRLVSLFEAQASYARSANESASHGYSAEGEGISLGDVNGITESGFWFRPLWDIVDEFETPTRWVTIVLWLGWLGAVFIVPVLVILYAIFLVWQQTTPVVSAVV